MNRHHRRRPTDIVEKGGKVPPSPPPHPGTQPHPPAPPSNKKPEGMTYDRAALVEVLVYHQRRDIEGCLCGWGVLGASHPEHVADVYEQKVRSGL